MDNRIMRTVLFAAFAFLYMSAFGAGAARFGTLRNSDWVVTNAWQAVSNKTHDLILEMGQGDSLPPDWQNVSNAAMNAVQSLQPAYEYADNAITSFSSTGSVFRSFSYGTSNYWTDATGCIWKVMSVPSGPWMATTNVITDVSMSPEDDLITYMPLTFRYLGRDCWSNVQPSEVADLTEFTVPTQGKNWGWYYLTDDEDQTQVYDSFPITFVRGTTVITNLVGRVALTNDISQFMSTNNSEFVSAVLSVPIVGASQSDLSEIAEYGTYGTVGAAILALIAGLAALKRGKLDGAAAYPAWVQDDYQPPAIVSHKGRLWSCQNYTIAEPGEESQSDWLEVTIKNLKQDALTAAQQAAVNSGATAAKVMAWDGYAAQIAQKASFADLSYALVTLGEYWIYSGVIDGLVITGSPVYEEVGGYYTLQATWHGDVIEGYSDSGLSEDDLSVSFTFDLQGTSAPTIVIATRSSLPGHLLDRAGNRVVVSGDTTLTLPASVPGYLRDFLVRLEISGSTVPTITFAAPTGETVTYETDGDEFPVPDAEGTWIYSFTESCVAHTFAVSLKKVNEVAQGGA